MTAPHLFIFQNKRFCLFLLILTVFRLIYISLIPLIPQEAYYWLFSIHPDLSYFDHPPMVAYSIWLGTFLFGQSIFGIKIIAVIWSALTNVLLYFTILNALDDTDSSKNKRIAFLTIVLYNLTIFSHLYAIIIVPDTPLLFFWLLIIFFLQKYLKHRQVRYVYLMGIALGLALLSKYTAIAILPAIVLVLVLDNEAKKIFFSPHPYLAIMMSIIIFSPVIIWNINHDWVSFQFQFKGRANALGRIQTKYFWQLLGSQLFMLTPLSFILFFTTTKRVIFGWFKYKKARTFFITAIFIIGGFIILSFNTLIKMNWLLPGYLGLIIATILVYRGDSIIKMRLFKLGIILSVFLIIISYSILLIPNLPLGDGNTWSGWRETAQSISKLREQMGGKDDMFIFSNSYKTASLLQYYLAGSEVVYAQNIYNEPALQFDIWGVPSSLNGKSALYIFTDRREYKPEIKKVETYFSEMSLLTKFTIYYKDSFETRVIFCYYAKNYRGPVEQKLINTKMNNVSLFHIEK